MTKGETRTERRRKATHRALLQSLFDLVVAKGLSEVTVHDIVEDADVAVGTFYNHFDSREAAISELVERLMTFKESAIEDLDELSADPLSALADLISTAIRMIDTERDWARFMAQIADTPFWPRGTLSSHLTRIIEAGQESGILSREGDPHQRAMLIGAHMRTALSLAASEAELMDRSLVLSTSLYAAGATSEQIAKFLNGEPVPVP